MAPKRKTRKDTKAEAQQTKESAKETKSSSKRTSKQDDDKRTSLKSRQESTHLAVPSTRTRRTARAAEENKENESRSKGDEAEGKRKSPKRKFESINDSINDIPLIKSSKPTDNNNAESDEVRKYHRLKEIRETGPEKALREYKNAVQARLQAADALFRELSTNGHLEDAKDYEEELEDLRENVDHLTNELQTAAEEIKMLKAKLYAAEKPRSEENDHKDKLALSLSADLSGLVIQNVEIEEDVITYKCLQKGRNGVFQYNLSLVNSDADQQEVTFTPVLDAEKDAELISLLPDYFSEPLSFTRDAVSCFTIYLHNARLLTRPHNFAGRLPSR